MTQREKEREVQAFVMLCMACLEDMDHKELIKKTGLSSSTLYRVLRGGVSLATRIGTVQAIGRAAGFTLTWTKNGRSVMRAA